SDRARRAGGGVMILDALACYVEPLALCARPTPAGEAEEARDHEQAGAGLGDHREAEAHAGVFMAGRSRQRAPRTKGISFRPRSTPSDAAPAVSAVVIERLVPFPDVSTLVEGAVGARRTRVTAHRRQISGTAVVTIRG